MLRANSAGLLLFRICPFDGRQFLILKAKWGERKWSFPKGHMEKGENALVCALRETKEETGIDEEEIQILPDEPRFATYSLPKPTKKIPDGIKRVEFMLAEVCSVIDVSLSKEHSDFKWVTPAESKSYLSPELHRLIMWSRT